MVAVKLLGASLSPYGCRVEIALKIKGIKYEFIEEDLSNKSALLLKSNPIHKKIPVLLHNDMPIVESLVILEYIDETFLGTPILPQDPYEKAMARFWAKFIEEKCLGALYKSVWSKGEEKEKAKEEAHEALKVLNDELKDKKFFGGENINFVDIVANFLALWLGILEQVLEVEFLNEEKCPRLREWITEKCPRLREWITECLNCSIIKENMPPRDKLVAHFQKIFQAANASN